VVGSISRYLNDPLNRELNAKVEEARLQIFGLPQVLEHAGIAKSALDWYGTGDEPELANFEMVNGNLVYLDSVEPIIEEAVHQVRDFEGQEEALRHTDPKEGFDYYHFMKITAEGLELLNQYGEDFTETLSIIDMRQAFPYVKQERGEEMASRLQAKYNTYLSSLADTIRLGQF
jgi:hypothetical protein